MTGLSKPPHLHRCKPSAMRTIRYRNFIRELLGSKYTRKCRFGHHTCYLKQERYRDFKTQDILNGLNRLRGSAAIHTKDQFKALRTRLFASFSGTADLADAGQGVLAISQKCRNVLLAVSWFGSFPGTIFTFSIVVACTLGSSPLP